MINLFLYHNDGSSLVNDRIILSYIPESLTSFIDVGIFKTTLMIVLRLIGIYVIINGEEGSSEF